MGYGDRVGITITEIMGSGMCPLGFKPGDSWEMHGEKIPNGFCSWAFQSLFPCITVFRFGGKFPWSEDSDRFKACCCDPANPVVFELTRITE